MPSVGTFSKCGTGGVTCCVVGACAVQQAMRVTAMFFVGCGSWLWGRRQLISGDVLKLSFCAQACVPLPCDPREHGGPG